MAPCWGRLRKRLPWEALRDAKWMGLADRRAMTSKGWGVEGSARAVPAKAREMVKTFISVDLKVTN